MNKTIIGGIIGVGLVAGAIVFTQNDTLAQSVKIDKRSETEVTRTVTTPAIAEKIETEIVTLEQIQKELEVASSSLEQAQTSKEYDVLQCDNAFKQHDDRITSLQALKDSLELQIQQAKDKGVKLPASEVKP